MKYTWIDEYLMSKPGVTKDHQKEWNWIRYHIGGKMFAAVCRDDSDKPVYITIKLEPLQGEALRKQFDDIIPGYYMNKIHWNSVKADGNVGDDVLENMLDCAYQLVLGSLSKKKQKEIIQTYCENDLISCCGSDCGACYCYPETCKGCNELCGKVFHAPKGKECPIYFCCRIRNGFHSCGECEELPCDLIKKTKDPSMSEEEFMNNVNERVRRLRGDKSGF